MPYCGLTGSVEEYAPLDIELIQSRKQRDLFRDLLSRHHYLGYATPFGAQLQYLVHVTRPRRELVGCIQFSSPAWRMKAREQWIGWDDKTRAANWIELGETNGRGRMDRAGKRHGTVTFKQGF